MTLFITNNMFGQISEQDELPNSTSLNQAPKQVTPLNYQKLHLSLNVGAGFAGSKYNSGVFTTIAPNLNYMATRRLKLEVGGVFMMGNNNFYQVPGNETRSNFLRRSTQTLIYAQGQYLLNDRLVLSGSVFKSFNPNASSKLNPYALDYKGMNIGLDYKVTKSISVGAQIRYSNGNQNYFLNQNGMGLSSSSQRDMFGW
jgi:hypothetical protein